MAKHFEADLKDGTRYIQGADDVSIDTPGKNAFYDILQRIDDVQKFYLVNEDGSEWAVDLSTGVFEHNGVPFGIHDQFLQPTAPLKLVYWMEVHQKLVAEPDKPTKHVGGYINRYFFGWKTKVGTKNVQHTISVM